MPRSGASSVRLSYMGPDSLEMQAGPKATALACASQPVISAQVVPPEVWWSSAGTLQVGTNTKFYAPSSVKSHSELDFRGFEGFSTLFGGFQSDSALAWRSDVRACVPTAGDYSKLLKLH